MSLVLVHARAQALELLRYPAASVPALLFPAILFLLFGLPGARGREGPVLAGFAGFAVLGIAFFQFGVGIAYDRVSPWERYLRTLPVAPLQRLAARTVAATGFAAASVVIVVAAASATMHVRLSAEAWATLGAALAAGAVPFVLAGIAIGYWVPHRAVLPVANILYLLLAYLGGLWTPPRDLPARVAAVSPYLPTRSWAELLGASATSRPWRTVDAAVLAGWAVAFAVAAVAGYRRDEGESFR